MAIKSGESITASDLTTLKNNILTMYNNRTVNVNGQQLSSDSNTYKSAVTNASFTAGSSITSGGLGALLKACLVINDIPNLLKAQDQDTLIFRDGSTTEILNEWLTDSLKNASGISDNYGCRGACVGICTYGCAGWCQGGCAGCSTLCQGSCKNGCGNNCSRTCSNSCTNSSGLDSSGIDCNGCHGSCYTSCNGCSATCKNGCTNCSGECQDTCLGGCATDCTSGCYGTATSGNYT